MNYKIETIPRFEKDVKRLKKKFPKIKDDLVELVELLSMNPEEGVGLGQNIYKIRLRNSSVTRGKSGGFRVITYYKKNDTLYLVTIYSKTEEDTVITEKLKKIVETEIEL